MLGGNDMAILLITVGVILVYISTGMMVIDFIKTNKKHLRYYDYIVAFIPMIRVFYMMIVEED